MTASGVGTSVKTNVVSSLPLLLGCWCLSISTSYTRAACERIAVNSAHALNSVASSTHIFPLNFTKHPARKFFGTLTFLHICQCLSYYVRNEKNNVALEAWSLSWSAHRCTVVRATAACGSKRWPQERFWSYVTGDSSMWNCSSDVTGYVRHSLSSRFCQIVRFQLIRSYFGVTIVLSPPQVECGESVCFICMHSCLELCNCRDW